MRGLCRLQMHTMDLHPNKKTLLPPEQLYREGRGWGHQRRQGMQNTVEKNNRFQLDWSDSQDNQGRMGDELRGYGYCGDCNTEESGRFILWVARPSQVRQDKEGYRQDGRNRLHRTRGNWCRQRLHQNSFYWCNQMRDRNKRQKRKLIINTNINILLYI